MNNLLSYSSLKLDRFSKEGERLTSASGFVIEAGTRHFLITNRHVVCQRDGHEAEQVEPSLEPYMLKTSVHIHGGAAEKSFPLYTGRRQRITLRLYDDAGAPQWMEHRDPKPGQPSADLAALPLRFDVVLELFSAKTPEIYGNASSWSTISNSWLKVSAIPLSGIHTDVEYAPPDAVHIIGYPLAWAPDGMDRSSSAFWRTSFIASEMYEGGQTRSDVFFVDPCAPEGMTGSPVVGLKNNRLKLLGIYSDQSTAEFGANAGFVRGAWLLKDLIGAS